MVATAWPSDGIGSYLSGDEAKAALPEAVWDRLKVALRGGGTIDLGSVSGGPSTSYTYASNVALYVPEALLVGEKLKFYFNLKRTGGTTAFGRVEETGGVVGSEASTTSTTGAVVVSEVTVQNGWAGTMQTFKLGARGDGTATSDADTDKLVMNLKGTD